MDIKEKVLAEIKLAMKAKQAERLTALRMIHAAFKDLEIEKRPGAPIAADYVKVLKKMKKQCLESIQMYQSAGREDQADKESREVELLGEFLPEELSEDQIQGFLEQAIQEISPEGMKDMGKIMARMTELTKGSADAKVVSQLVRTRLQ